MKNRLVVAIVAALIGAGIGFTAAWLVAESRVTDAKNEAVALSAAETLQNRAFVERMEAERAGLAEKAKALSEVTVKDQRSAFEALCRASSGCADSGDCSYQEPSMLEPLGRCVPASDADCAKTRDCLTFGSCGVVPDAKFGRHRCQPTKDEHCVGTYRCQEKPCRVVGDECVPR